MAVCFWLQCYLHSTVGCPSSARLNINDGGLLDMDYDWAPAPLAQGGFAGICPALLALSAAYLLPSPSSHAPKQDSTGNYSGRCLVDSLLCYTAGNCFCSMP
eukprot:GHRR01025210.1.p1 GENE.GHRR01025210.1~~GHRR01025210.1.p1  ORF type:complete len:102 (-),score=20.08 GHRR01025210.1:256-561(-)